MRKLSLILFAALLSACSSQPPAALTKINAIQIPVVQNGQPSGNTAAMTAIYQQNKRILDNTSLNLKTDYLADVKTAEIFDEHSEAHLVYVSLSKLDQIQLMNNYYLKEQNASGLQKVIEALRPLIQG